MNNWNEELRNMEEFYLSSALLDPYQSHFGLHGGRSGTILLQTLLYNNSKSDILLESIKTNYLYTLDILEKSESIESSFCNGLAGWGWLNIQLLRHGLLPELHLEDNLDEIDKVLKKAVNYCLDKKDFDMLHGSLGIGLYYLERKKETSLIRKIIKSLKDNCLIDKEKQESRWERFDKYGSLEYIYDFGLSHGNAGIIYFLFKCYQNGFEKETKNLIKGSINFFMNNVQNHTLVGSFFPQSIRKERYLNGAQPSKSRVAWCYGDLGILHTLLLVTNEIKDSVNYNKVVEMLKVSAKRKSKKSTELVDAGFCHGVSGVAIMYYSIYQITGNKIFKQSYDYWFQVMLKTGRGRPQNYANYSFYRSDEVGWDKMADILTGLGGVVLAILTIKRETSNWMGCFFLN